MRTVLTRQINDGIFRLKASDCPRTCATWHSGVGIEREDCIECCPHFVGAEPSRGNPGYNRVQCTVTAEELVALALMEE